MKKFFYLLANMEQMSFGAQITVAGAVYVFLIISIFVALS